MAYAMMGGIIAGTLVTLIFVPALYCAVFRVKALPGDGMPSTEDRACGGASVAAGQTGYLLGHGRLSERPAAG